jgi:predicted HTH transcriptional regulator
MNKDIFDLENIEDIPKELEKLLSFRKENPADEEVKIFELFDTRKRLTRNELMVAFYRKYNRVITQNFLYYRLSLLIKKGKIKKLDKSKNNQYELAVYEKID